MNGQRKIDRQIHIHIAYIQTDRYINTYVNIQSERHRKKDREIKRQAEKYEYADEYYHVFKVCVS
jgi:hypothetical protein